jgi:ABC-2 type transport system permease protein
MNLKKYYAVVKTSLVEKFSHFWDRAALAFILALILFIFLQMWQAVYGEQSSIEGYTIAQMIWYLTLTEVILFSTGSNKIEKIGDDIRSGEIANALLKPFNYIGREFSVLVSEFIYSFSVIGVIGAILAYLFVGPIEVSAIGLILTFLLVLGSAIISFLIVLVLAMTALWLEDTSSIMWIYQKLLFIIGGMLLPLDFYPNWLQQLTTYLPTSYMMYLPAKTFVHFSISGFLSTIIGQIAWIVVLFGILVLIYKKGIKEVSLNGG